MKNNQSLGQNIHLILPISHSKIKMIGREWGGFFGWLLWVFFPLCPRNSNSGDVSLVKGKCYS